MSLKEERGQEGWQAGGKTPLERSAKINSVMVSERRPGQGGGGGSLCLYYALYLWAFRRRRGGGREEERAKEAYLHLERRRKVALEEAGRLGWLAFYKPS